MRITDYDILHTYPVPGLSTECRELLMLCLISLSMACRTDISPRAAFANEIRHRLSLEEVRAQRCAAVSMGDALGSSHDLHTSTGYLRADRLFEDMKQHAVMMLVANLKGWNYNKTVYPSRCFDGPHDMLLRDGIASTLLQKWAEGIPPLP